MGLILNNLFAQAQQRDTTKSTTTTPASPQTPTGDLVSVLTASADYATFGLAIRSANMDATLKGAGPYTVFAPDNAAFSKLPQGRLDSLMKDPAKLSAILKEHVVAGTFTKADIIKALTMGKGKTTLKTIDGQSLTLSVFEQKNLQLTDAMGNSALVTSFDLPATNGTIHGLNAVLTK
ncbi:MAG: fasciclin protein [Mucilaginibacter sp.]|nr:fasciclin protein [Mucilaginibacter sp.]